MNTNTKYLIMGSISFFVIMISIIYYYLYETKYTVLVKDLRGENVEYIVEHLKTEGITYKISNDGNKLLVDEQHIESLRSEFLMTQLSTNSSVGFELFDNTDIGMTEFAQKLNHQRALQGELSKTISAFPEIRYARIHLVMPESKLFGKQNKSAKASVSLFLNQGMVLTEQQIKGIKKIVAASVPELLEDNVTVNDQNGVILGRQVNEEVEAALGSNRLELKQKVETYFIKKVQTVLEHMYGKNNALMTIDVDLQLNDIKMVKEGLLPSDDKSSGALLRKKESIVSNKTVQQGKTKNLPSNKVVELEYKYGKKIENITIKPGSIARISIGVLLPGEVDETVKASVTNIVSMAVGLDTSRGDEIKVHFIGDLPAKNSSPQRQTLEVDLAETNSSGREIGVRMSAKSDAKKKSSIQSLEKTKASRQWMNESYVYIVFFIFLLILALVAMMYRGQKSQQFNHNLTHRERQQSYELMQQWLNAKER